MFTAAALIALALAQPDASITMDGIKSGNNPNYKPTSVRVESTTNPMYSFPADVDNQHTINGRLYKGVPMIGGVEVGPKSDLDRAAGAYGAYGEENNRIQAEVQGLFHFHPTTLVEFSPWTSVPEQKTSDASDAYSRGYEKMAHRAEEARQQWLKDNNYVGGVRTFVNDAELYPMPPEARKSELPKPRGIIELSPEVPAFRSRMHVQGQFHLPPNMRTAELIKVVRPEAEKAQAVAKTEVKADEKPAEKVAAK
jgi:hypothetical protein